MKSPRLFAALTAVALASASPIAQDLPAQAPPAPALTPQQQNEEMLKELRAIRMLLERLTTLHSSRPRRRSRRRRRSPT